MLAFVIQRHQNRAGANLGIVLYLACYTSHSRELKPPAIPGRFSNIDLASA
jgi:hypothetical protein